jgi:hypothetical protein
MDCLSYYWKILATAFSQSLDTAQAIIFVIIIVAGIVTYLFPGVKMTADLNGWQVSAIVLGSIITVRLLLAPYWIHKEQVAKIRDLCNKLANPALDLHRRQVEAHEAHTQELARHRE